MFATRQAAIILMPCAVINFFTHFLCSFYFGASPELLVSDLDILKDVMVKDFDSFMDRPVRGTEHMCMSKQNLT